MTPPPSVRIGSHVNFRDLGGAECQDGLVVRRDVLYRSEAPGRVRDDDRPGFRALAVRCIVDLRTSAEREVDEAVWYDPGHAVDTVTVPGSDDLEAAAMGSFAQAVLTGRDRATEDLLLALYRRFPATLSPLVGLIAERIISGRGPVLVHCAAGKDRTGFVCAALLYVLGASPAAIEADYMSSNESFGAERIARLLSAGAGRTVPKEAAERLCCRPDYLEASFDVMNQASGSIDAYLEDHCGITRQLRDDFRAAALAPTW